MGDPLNDLKRTAAQYQAAAMQHVTFSTDREDMKASCDNLRAMLQGWRAVSKSVEQTLVGQLRLVQERCDHKGAQVGYNERDGDWMNACPTCGMTK